MVLTHTPGNVRRLAAHRRYIPANVPLMKRIAAQGGDDVCAVTDEGDGRTWLATPDYQRIAAFKKPAVDPKPSLFSGRLPGNTRLVEALRIGRGKLRWPPADA